MENTGLVVGLSGKAGAGKDTAASKIVNWGIRNGVEIHPIAFADPLRQVCAYLGLDAVSRREKEKVVFLTMDDPEGQIFRALESSDIRAELTEDEMACAFANLVTSLSSEHAFINRGDIGRERLRSSPRRMMQLIGDAVRFARPSAFIDIVLSKRPAPGSVMLITDVRYKNERDICGAGIHIDRPTEASIAGNHSSEAGIDELRGLASVVIDNDASLDKFECLCCGAAEEIIGDGGY